MDNLKARFNNVTFQIDKLLESLASANIKVSIRYGTDSRVEDIRFSCVVGKHRERWLIRLYPDKGSLTVSGGVAKTFFGHNLWVFNNEHAQLQAILGIIAQRLAEFNGITLPDSLSKGVFDDVTVERVELTNHFVLPPSVNQSEAIGRLDMVFKVLFPDRRDRDGDTLDKPGTVSIGKSKSTKVCRVYDPSLKFPLKPAHVSQVAWANLTAACSDHLRVELIMDTREIKQLSLKTVDAWRDHDKIQGYLAKKSQRYGLTVAYTTSAASLLPSAVKATNPTFVEYVRYWVTNGVRGTEPNKRNGSYNRYRQYMADRGFNISVSLERHQLLAHDLHEILKPDMRAKLPNDVRQGQELFFKWWEPKT